MRKVNEVSSRYSVSEIKEAPKIKQFGDKKLSHIFFYYLLTAH